MSRVRRVSPERFDQEVVATSTSQQLAKLAEMKKFGWRVFQIGQRQGQHVLWCACDPAVTALKVNPRANHSYITPDGVMTRYDPKRR